MIWWSAMRSPSGTSNPFSVWIDGLFWLNTYTPPPKRVCTLT